MGQLPCNDILNFVSSINQNTFISFTLLNWKKTKDLKDRDEVKAYIVLGIATGSLWLNKHLEIDWKLVHSEQLCNSRPDSLIKRSDVIYSDITLEYVQKAFIHK